MAIRFKDDEDGGAKTEKSPAQRPAKPEAPELEQEAQLPFAKPVRPEKKKRR